MTDRIERHVEVQASVERVWRALTDAAEFGRWFRVALEGPFVEGEPIRGRITYPGYEHLVWEARVVAIEPMRRFAFTWHPYAIDPAVDYSAEEPTLVEFLVEPLGSGSKVTVIESGFDKVPAYRRDEALRMNEGGWTMQVHNICAHVDD